MYYLQERHTIGEFKSKKEAIQDMYNQEEWYPENSFYVVDEKGENVLQTKNEAFRQVVNLMNKFNIVPQDFVTQYNKVAMPQD